MKFKLDLVQPCYNPSPNWDKNLCEHFEKLQALLPDYQIHLLVINDGSLRNVNEEHVEFLQKNIPNFQYISYSENQGKGFAMRTAIKKTTSDFIIYTDIDFPFELEGIVKIVEKLAAGVQVVAGVRDESYYQNLSAQRRLLSRVSKLLNLIFLKIPFTDTQSGLKGMNSEGRKLFLQTTVKRFLFDTEFLSMAARKKLRLETVTIRLRKGILYSTMSWKVVLQEVGNFAKILLKSVFS